MPPVCVAYFCARTLCIQTTWAHNISATIFNFPLSPPPASHSNSFISQSHSKRTHTHTNTHSHDLLSLERPVCDYRIICGFINFLWPLPLAAMPSPHRCRKLCAVRCALLLLLLWLLCWVYQISNGANCCSQPLSGLSDLLFFSWI